MPGAQRARSLVCVKKQTHERSHHGHTGNHPAFPAQWFYGFLRALPGDQACLTPSPALLIADLTPALGRQNDTTSPYASAPFVTRAAASTASRPASVTCATPLRGTGPNRYSADFTPPSSGNSENPKFVGEGGAGWRRQREDGFVGVWPTTLGQLRCRIGILSALSSCEMA